MQVLKIGGDGRGGREGGMEGGGEGGEGGMYFICCMIDIANKSTRLWRFHCIVLRTCNYINSYENLPCNSSMAGSVVKFVPEVRTQ